MSQTYPRKFQLGEIVLITGLSGKDVKYNGREARITSVSYIHPTEDKIVFNVMIAGAGLYALEPWNLKKSELDPYDGNKVGKWSDCVWQPDPNFRNDDYTL
jgi:hypothetical protein